MTAVANMRGLVHFHMNRDLLPPDVQALAQEALAYYQDEEDSACEATLVDAQVILNQRGITLKDFSMSDIARFRLFERELAQRK